MSEIWCRVSSPVIELLLHLQLVAVTRSLWTLLRSEAQIIISD